MYTCRAWGVVLGVSLFTFTALSSETQSQSLVQGRSGFAVKPRPVDTTPTVAISSQGKGVGTSQHTTHSEQAKPYFNASRSLGNPALVTATKSDDQSESNP